MENYKCRCGKQGFTINEEGTNKAVRCLSCNRWYKWANKDDVAYFKVKEVVGQKFNELTFGEAMNYIRGNENCSMRLPYWQDDVLITIQRPDSHSKMTSPYLYVKSRYGTSVWNPTQIELFSESWMLIRQ